MEYFKANIVPGEVIVQLIAFIIVFWTLKILAWKPLLGAIASRRERIKNEFDGIDASKKEIEALKAEYQTHLKKIEDEARVRIQEAVEEGRAAAHAIENQSRDEAKRIMEKAQTNIQLEVDKARIELRRQIADLAIKATEQILKEKVDEARHHKMMMEFIDSESVKR
jgi:F-type H+-transporting ATPase subunit b